MPGKGQATSAEAELASHFAKYDPATAKLGKSLRAKLRARLPGLFEIVYVYENQNALLISYSPTEKGYQGIFSLAVYPDAVKLCFGQGAQLAKSDPDKLLQGSGKTVRHVVLTSVADFNRAEVQALMTAAVKLAKLRPVAGAKGQVISKAASQKRRASRAAKSRAGRIRPAQA